MGVVDARRQRHDSWAVLREAYAPAGLDAVRLSRAPDGTHHVMMTLRARGPVESDLPAYTLQGYRLGWEVVAPEGQRVLAQGSMALPTRPPGCNVVGGVAWTAPTDDYRFILRLLRPTGFAALEHTYDASGERR